MTSNEFRRRNVEFALESIYKKGKRSEYNTRAILFVSVSLIIFFVLILIVTEN